MKTRGQYEAYFKKLAGAERVVVIDAGKDIRLILEFRLTGINILDSILEICKAVGGSK